MAHDEKGGDQTVTQVTLSLPERELADEVAHERAKAVRLLEVGAHQRAFSELARACRHLPMTGRLASYLVDVALRAGQEEAAVTALSAAIEVAEPDARIPLRRALARLYRRMGEPLRALTALRELVSDAPDDRRAKAVIAAILSTGLAAPFAPAADGEDPISQRVLEAGFVARGEWDELVAFYRARIATSGPTAKVEYLFRLAEVLEDELEDPPAAAEAYGEIVSLTQDPRALKEQVRVLAMAGNTGVRRALQAAVEAAAPGKARADALVARGESARGSGDEASAQADLERALQEQPGHLGALLGLAELGRLPRSSEAALRDAVASAEGSRLEPLRRLGRAASRVLRNPELARWAWRELATISPADAEAHQQLLAHARATHDGAALEQLLRGQLAREPRGESARRARLELTQLLEKAGRSEDALVELAAATRWDPAHKEAWLALAERQLSLQRFQEAAASLEQAATCCEDEAEREALWNRLASFAAEVLRDPKAAVRYSARARNVQAQRPEAAPAVHGHSGDQTESALPALRGAPGEPAAPVPPPARDPDGTPITSPGERDRHQTQEFSVHFADEPRPEPASAADRLAARAEEEPLEPRWYREWADAVEPTDAPRARALRAVAEAIGGAAPIDRPPPAELITEAQRAALHHPGLSGDSARLLTLCGHALFRAFAPKPPHLPSSHHVPPRVADAFVEAVRVLGVGVAELVMVDSPELSASADWIEVPRVMISDRLGKEPLTPAELRFYAGRAVFSLLPELLVLRTLTRERVLRAIGVLSALARPGGQLTADARVLRTHLSPRALEALPTLVPKARKELDLGTLARAARHTANRAGLIAAGAIGPAVSALRRVQTADVELVELVRFAASPQYLRAGSGR